MVTSFALQMTAEWPETCSFGIAFIWPLARSIFHPDVKYDSLIDMNDEGFDITCDVDCTTDFFVALLLDKKSLSNILGIEQKVSRL